MKIVKKVKPRIKIGKCLVYVTSIQFNQVLNEIIKAKM